MPLSRKRFEKIGRRGLLANVILPATFTTIDREAGAAIQKHGHLNTPINSKSDALVNLSILLEEVGEVAHALNEKDSENLKEELAQVAAVCAMWLDGIAIAEYEAKQAEEPPEYCAKCGTGLVWGRCAWCQPEEFIGYDPCCCDDYGTCWPYHDREAW